MICWSPPVNNDKVCEVNSRGAKRYVENTQKCTRLNSILASRYCLLGHAGFGLASDDDEDQMYSICMLAGALQRAGLTNQFWVAPVNNHRVVFFSEDDDDNNDDDNDEEDVGSSDLYAD